jgi:GDP/UDP-N,N'-diacetylbacillosamine 2-epimerase (hydrolysing)
MNEKRKIFIVSERRADYSRFKPILREMKKDLELDFDLVITGTHLLKKYGLTINEIKKDGFKIFSTFEMFDENDTNDTGSKMTRSLGTVLKGITYEIENSKPDIILSGFDIAANLAATIAGAHMNIPIAHIQGGEISGTIDESIRHAMSKFAHYHFVANKDARERLIKMGEIPERIFIVGNPSIDAMLQVKDISKKELEKEFKIDMNKPYILIIQHPVTSEIMDTEKQINETINAIKEIGIQSIFIYPNNDAGTTKIINNIEGSNLRHVNSLSIDKYINLLKHSSALVGNSSGGIHETATFHIPTINIGTRQQGRLKAENVINVNYDKNEIKKAISKALYDKLFLDTISNCKNPYGDGTSAKKIVKLLKEIDIGQDVIQKRMTY